MPDFAPPAATALRPAPDGSSIRQRRPPSAVAGSPGAGDPAASVHSIATAFAAGPVAATSITPANRPVAISAVAGIDHSAASSAGGPTGISAASTVTAKPSAAEPPELVAVTSTVSDRARSVGIDTTPVSGSTVAPAPETVKRRPPPRNAGAAATSQLPVPWSRISSSSTPAATGAA